MRLSGLKEVIPRNRCWQLWRIVRWDFLARKWQSCICWYWWNCSGASYQAFLRGSFVLDAFDLSWLWPEGYWYIQSLTFNMKKRTEVPNMTTSLALSWFTNSTWFINGCFKLFILELNIQRHISFGLIQCFLHTIDYRFPDKI